MTRTVAAADYGGPEVLELQHIVLQQPEQGQVLGDVKTAGANPVDYKLYSGGRGAPLSADRARPRKSRTRPLT